MAAAEGLAQIPEVDIDSDGVFKYVLIRVHAGGSSGAPAEEKEIVRGYKWAEYHGEGGTGGNRAGAGRNPSWSWAGPGRGWGRGGAGRGKNQIRGGATQGWGGARARLGAVP